MMKRQTLIIMGVMLALVLLLGVLIVPAGSQTALTDDGGVGQCTTDVNGYCTQTHVLGQVPTDIQVTAISGFNAVRVDNQTSTNFRVRAYQGSTLKTATAIVFWWHIFAKPVDITTTTVPATSTSTTTTAAPSTTTINPTTTTLAPIADPVIEGAGDIAGANSDGSLRHQSETAAIILADNPTAAFTLGDNAYPNGALSDYNAYYDASWGKFNTIMRPSPGNHEYFTANAQGYIDYFEPKSVQIRNPQDNGLYYSWDLGNWHIVALNSEVSHSVGSAELSWLHQDLASTTKNCILAYWHKPLFASSTSFSTGAVTFWNELYAAHADVVLNGHAHFYERFAKQSPSGNVDPNGIREIIAGTGGKSIATFGTFLANSEVHFGGYGILKLTLHDNSYDWQWKGTPAYSSLTDSGTTTCN